MSSDGAKVGLAFLAGVGATMAARLLCRCAFCHTPASSSSHAKPSSEKVELPLPRRETKGNAPLSATVMANKETLEDLDYAGKRVLVRVDYNVPMKGDIITDTARIDQTIDTLKYILEDRGKKGAVKCVVLIAHMGRPAGDYKKEDYSLRPVVAVLQKYFPDNKVIFCDDCASDATIETTKTCPPKSIILCENLRFYIEETGSGLTADKQKIKASKEDVEKFQARLTQLGDCFVFEGFGASHRPHASVVGINLPQRVAGHLMGKELKIYSEMFANPQRPFLAIVGGAKIADKVAVLENLLDMADEIIVAGAMAYTFLKVTQGVNIGASLFDSEGAELVKKIMKKAKERSVPIHLPVDHIIGSSFKEDCDIGCTDNTTGIPPGWLGLDVGPKSRQANGNAIMRAKTILWNGPLGVFEWGAFAGGTLSAMASMVEATKKGATTVVGGGDTGAACSKFIVGSKFVSEQLTHVSTGGGSSLVLMEGKMLPGVEALSDKKK